MQSCELSKFLNGPPPGATFPFFAKTSRSLFRTQLTGVRPRKDPSAPNTGFTLPEPVYISMHVGSRCTRQDPWRVGENAPFPGPETGPQGGPRPAQAMEPESRRESSEPGSLIPGLCTPVHLIGLHRYAGTTPFRVLAGGIRRQEAPL